MALWSIIAAPLILSVDLRTIPDWAREIILNKNLIGINQDPLGIMDRRILRGGVGEGEGLLLASPSPSNLHTFTHTQCF
jgi:hypothetical protein